MSVWPIVALSYKTGVCKEIYCIAGNFRGEIFSWFSIIKFIRGKKFVVYSWVLSQLNHKIKSSWVKHSWFYLNHENHKIFSPRKFPAIRYISCTYVGESYKLTVR